MADGERDPFAKALGAIRRRERSTAEIIDWLAERDYGPEEIESAISRLIECGELDDRRFAELFAEDKRELAGWGPERIAAALSERGIDRELVETVSLETHDEQVDRAVALLHERRFVLADDGDRQRALGLLNRRGYGYEVAHEAIRLAGRDHGAAAA
ncbi:MAG TPA: regulatory protein RecX [Solirubrobacterales bacterium]|nr:regulatory protein RecX [Solirubrobacterales bacterium]